MTSIVAIGPTANEYSTHVATRCMLFTLLLFSTAPVEALDPSEIQCNASTGLSQPLPVCTSDSPCSTQLGDTITTPSSRPICATLSINGPRYNDEPVFAWLDQQNTVRFACVYKNPAASTSTPLPLILVLHGGESSAGFVYNRTLLRDKAEVFDLSGELSRPGFVLVSIQGRNLHFPTGLPPFSREGSHHDFYFRDFTTNSTNPDVKFMDLTIDLLAGQGIIDPQRIYVLGHSNGGFMAQAYAIARHATPTPGGHYVAAAAAYGAADPFNNIYHGMLPSCRLDPYPRSNVPLFLLQRDCDSQNACNLEQQERFGTSPGYNLQLWLNAIRPLLGNTNVDFQLIDSQGYPKNTCSATPECTPYRGILNHIKWPDGRTDAAGIDWEVDILGFLRDHPHPLVR